METNPGLADYARRPRWFLSGPAIVSALAVLKLGLHLATAALYGFFIDELYFLACGQHLAWGYVDFPPLTAFQAWLTRALLGDSPYSIRFFPALAGAGTVFITGMLARRLGGGRFAQALAALVVLTAPLFLAFSSYLSMNPIEPLFWIGCAYLVLRMIQTGNTRLWIPFGFLAGLGVLNKHTMLLFGFALIVGLLLTPERRLLKSRWIIVGGLIAFLVILPHLLWEIRNGFPHFEVLANIRRDGRDVGVGFFGFWLFEIVLLNPAAAPVWIAGLVGLFTSRRLKTARAFGWAFLIIVVFLFLTTPGSHKTYYAGAAYPILLAAGAVLIEEALRSRRTAWLKPVAVVLIIALGAVGAPLITPILPPETFLRYMAALPFPMPRFENRATNAMPQLFADRFGWPEMVKTVAGVYNALPPDVRAKTGIFGNDFGQAGAIDFYGPRYSLPKAISGHLTYWYWGPRNYTGESMIVLGERREELEREFEEVQAVAAVGHPYAMRQEHFTIFLCSKPRGWTISSIWPQVKNWH
jgi:hypothetical protein